MIQSVDKLRHYSDTINSLAGRGKDKWISFGDFTISGPQGNSLLATAAAALGDLGLDNWTDLAFSGQGLSLDAFKQQLRDALGETIGGAVDQIYDSLTGENQGTGLIIDIPVAKDPTGVAMGFLLGQDHDLVTVTGKLNLTVDELINVSPIPGLIIGMRPRGRSPRSPKSVTTRKVCARQLHHCTRGRTLTHRSSSTEFGSTARRA